MTNLDAPVGHGDPLTDEKVQHLLFDGLQVRHGGFNVRGCSLGVRPGLNLQATNYYANSYRVGPPANVDMKYKA